MARWYAQRFPHAGVDRMLRLVHPTDAAAVRWSFAGAVPFEKGLRLNVDTGTWLGWYIYFYGAYRPVALAAARAALRPGDVAIDVGASLGDFTVVMASAVTESGAVHAFEPWPPEYQRCVKNVELNGLLNVVVQQKAVSATSREITLYGSLGFNQSINKLKRFGADLVPIQCSTISIDEYAGELPRLDLIKLDSLGADLLVLEGARQTLQTHRPGLLLNSVNEVNYQGFGYGTADVLRLLDDHGYTVRWLPESSSRLATRQSPANATRACYAYHDTSRSGI